MSNLVIKKHDFNIAKERIQKYSQQRVDELRIASVSSRGTSILGNWLGTQHNVTGSEFNDRIKVIMEHLNELNKKANSNIREFGEIYNALEALDSEYIASILSNIKAIEETNNDLKDKQEQINEIVKRLKKLSNDHQQEIEKHAETINLIMHSLIEFSDKVKLSLYDDNGEILNLKLINKEVNKQKDYINSLDIILSDILKNNHLKDIDEIWNYYVTSYNQVGIIKNQISSIEAMILELDNKINKTIEEFNILNNTFDDKQEQFNEIIQNKEKEYDSKIRRANIIAGLSLLLAIISIGLNYI